MTLKKEFSWKDNESVKTWLTGLDRHSKHDYELKFSKFLEYIKLSPDEILAARIKDLCSQDPRIRSTWEQKILQWRESLEQQGLKSWTLHQHLKAVMSFFSRNRVKLVFRRGDIPTPRTKRAEWIPNNIQIRQLYNASDIRDKSILLFAYQCGLSPVDISELSIENLPIYDSNGQININDTLYFEIYRTKTDMLTQSVMSIELLHDLDLYLRSRGYPKEGALFIGHKGNRLAPEDMSIILKDKAKLVLGELGKKFHLSLLRKSFQNALDNTPAVSRAFTESMMGHSKGITDAYSQPSSAEIKTAYDLIHPRLSINGYVQARTDLKDIGQKLEKQNDTISILARAMARSIAEQKKIEGLSLMTHEETMDFLRTWTTTEQIGLGKKKKEVGEE